MNSDNYINEEEKEQEYTIIIPRKVTRSITRDNILAHKKF